MVSKQEVQDLKNTACGVKWQARPRTCKPRRQIRKFGTRRSARSVAVTKQRINKKSMERSNNKKRITSKPLPTTDGGARRKPVSSPGFPIPFPMINYGGLSLCSRWGSCSICKKRLKSEGAGATVVQVNGCFRIQLPSTTTMSKTTIATTTPTPTTETASTGSLTTPNTTSTPVAAETVEVITPSSPPRTSSGDVDGVRDGEVDINVGAAEGVGDAGGDRGDEGDGAWGDGDKVNAGEGTLTSTSTDIPTAVTTTDQPTPTQPTPSQPTTTPTTPTTTTTDTTTTPTTPTITSDIPSTDLTTGLTPPSITSTTITNTPDKKRKKNDIPRDEMENNNNNDKKKKRRVTKTRTMLATIEEGVALLRDNPLGDHVQSGYSVFLGSYPR